MEEGAMLTVCTRDRELNTWLATIDSAGKVTIDLEGVTVGLGTLRYDCDEWGQYALIEQDGEGATIDEDILNELGELLAVRVEEELSLARVEAVWNGPW